MPSANFRSWIGSATAQFRGDTPRAQSQEWPSVRRARAEPPLRHRRLPQRKARWYRASLPEFAINILKGFFDPFFDLPSLFVEMFEPSEMLHPGSFLRSCLQFLLNGLGDELAQGDATFGGDRFGPAEQEVRDFKGGLHPS